MKFQLIHVIILCLSLCFFACGEGATNSNNQGANAAAPKVIVSEADKQLAKMANTPEGAATAIEMHTKILSREYCNCNKINKDQDRVSCLGRNSSKVRSIQKEYPKEYHDQFMVKFKDKTKNC